MIPRQRGEPHISALRQDGWNRRDGTALPSAFLWPSVWDTDEALAPAREDTVKQILRGEGHYYGMGAYVQPDPDMARGIKARQPGYRPPRTRKRRE